MNNSNNFSENLIEFQQNFSSSAGVSQKIITTVPEKQFPRQFLNLYVFIPSWAKKYSAIIKKILAMLSKLHSTCPEEHFSAKTSRQRC